MDDTQKVLRLIAYLQALASLRTKLIRGVSEYERIFWFSSVPHELGCFTQAWGRDEEHNPDQWLEVQNQKEPTLPAVPASCKDWEDPSSLRNKSDLPELRTEITRQIPNPAWREDSDQPKAIPHTEHLEDHPEIQQAWEGYVEDKWMLWAEEHNRWEKVHKLYAALFAIHQEQRRLGEEYELVLGLGLLTWQTPTGQSVCRHLVVADAMLEFEAQRGIFTVRPNSDGAKLRPELDMLDAEARPARAEETAKALLTAATDDPWEKGCVEGVLQALVHSINAEGAYHESLETNNIRVSAKPIVEYAPALILRKRSAKGLMETLAKIKEQIENGGKIPSEWADLAEIRPLDAREPDNEPQEPTTVSDDEIFFPKPANKEQRRIVSKMRSSSGVLVQGPPGTGKSHTIANLISHLLATGQRTLITAKTPRALQVLAGFLPDELRPLCINLLGSGIEERQSLEASVGGILGKSGNWNEDKAEEEREEFEKRLGQLREERATINRRLRDIRESETHTQSIADGTYRGTAARVAEDVNRDKNRFVWFTDSVSLDKPCPVSADGLQKILMVLRRLTAEKRRDLSLIWPEALLSSESFTTLVRDEISATEEERNLAYGADEQITAILTKITPPAIDALSNACWTFLTNYKELLGRRHSWMENAVRDVLGGNAAPWHEILHVTKDVITSVEGLVGIADATDIEFPGTTNVGLLHKDARVLQKHLENGGKLGGLFRHQVVKERLYVLKTVRINGRTCATATAEHFSSLADALHVRIECERAWNFWQGRSDKNNGPYALQLASLTSLRDALEKTLALEKRIAGCQEALKQCPGLGVPDWTDQFQIARLIASCSLALAHIRKQDTVKAIQAVETSIMQVAARGDAHPVANDLLTAIRNRDITGFAHCAETIQDLEKWRQYLDQVDESLAKLRHSLPQLIQTLEQTCTESYWDERVQHIGDAWHWAQARYWIEDYIRKEDVPALTTRAKQIADEIKSRIAKLAALHAWSFCFSRLEEDHRRHMEAWRQAMKKLGKGTGKFAPYWRWEAQQHLNGCREAVPAWVMPLHRLWDTVQPAPGMFDVIIVDEASQCGFEAFPLFYLGKKIVIVGDDQQISPDAVGIEGEAVKSLMREYLYDFKFTSSFDIESSLFDHGALRHGTHRITLREHFRCMPEIIRFSNDLCYSATPLIPLRQYGPDRLPPLEHFCVRDGYRKGTGSRMINPPEAEAIVEKITELCGDSRYDGKTMGVVVLQGQAQADLIGELLLKRLGAEQMEQRRLICGNPYSFQGDQRDIMFLSLVAANDNNGRIGTLTKEADKRRFNVAASRARDQMILFHSVGRHDLSPSCLRRQLLEFFENTRQPTSPGFDKDKLERQAAQANRSVVDPDPPFDSWFEVDVALELLRKHFVVVPQYEIAGKWIDLVVEGGQVRLAIECDGDHWHGPNRYEEDMQRQRQLERCGWEFFRVRESAFYADKENALARLWNMLEERGIFPNWQHRVEPGINLSEGESVELGGAAPARDDRSEENTPDGDAVINDHGNAEDDDIDENEEDDALSDTEEAVLSGNRLEEVSETDIQNAILRVLSHCPNYSCTLHSLTARVLKEVGVRTRGNPREVFERRTMRCVGGLERAGRIEQYKAKNQRLRLISHKAAMCQGSLF